MSLPRAAAGSVLFGTYNVLDLFAVDGQAGRAHYDQVVRVIRALDADVLAVQEIRAPNEDMARQRLRRLAGDVGMNCDVPVRGRKAPALGAGSHGYHLGLLWRPGIDPVPGSLRSRDQDLWHSLAWVTLDVGGCQVRHAVYHATPFSRRSRVVENELVVATLATPVAAIPTLIGADWNCESADRVPSEQPSEQPGEWRLYEPGDPFAAVGWFGPLIYQCDWSYDEQGRRRHWVDRSAGEALFAGGLHDAAAVLRAPWQPTTGHYPGDPYGEQGISRRIDAVRVSRDVRAALRACHVTDTEFTREVSDHLPVTVEYVPGAIAG